MKSGAEAEPRRKGRSMVEAGFAVAVVTSAVEEEVAAAVATVVEEAAVVAGVETKGGGEVILASLEPHKPFWLKSIRHCFVEGSWCARGVLWISQSGFSLCFFSFGRCVS